MCVLCQSVGIHNTWTLKTEPAEWNSAAAGIVHTCTFPHRETSSGEEKGSLWETHLAGSCTSLTDTLVLLANSQQPPGHNFPPAEGMLAAYYQYWVLVQPHWLLCSIRQRWQSIHIKKKLPLVKQDICWSVTPNPRYSKSPSEIYPIYIWNITKVSSMVFSM